MTWNAANPAGTTKIRLSDEQIRANNDALEDALGRNHDFPGTEGGDAGEHTVVELQDQAGDATTPASVIGVYNNADALYARLASNGRIIPLETEIVTLPKTSAYTAVLADFGKLLLVTNTTTITLTAAATLGDGWHIYIKNNGSGVVTVDGDGSETIDGAATVAVTAQDDTIHIVCDGSNFHILSVIDTNDPAIADFTNATHDHADAAGGGNLGQASATDITITGSSASTPDANTLTKDLMIGARCTFNGTGTPAYIEEVNFTGAITDNGSGQYTLTIDRNMANANYSGFVTPGGGITDQIGATQNETVGSVDIEIATGGGANTDHARISVVLIGAH